MSKEIQEFIEKLKDWKNNFPIQDYDYTKYNCEVADIAKWQREDNIGELINFWNGKIREDFFELKHPIYNNIIVRAVKNYQLGIHNFILFTDKYYKNFFILGQSLNAVDIFVTPTHINVLVKHAVHFIIENLQYINDDNFYNFDTRWCFFLKQPRPYHFFIDELSNLYQLNVKNI
ncbi:alpha-2,3-sialyltransferase, partial [Campylobacter coli]|nr:alpha-2,3-sialyltransferase [Campylobacter coli]